MMTILAAVEDVEDLEDQADALPSNLEPLWDKLNAPMQPVILFSY